MACTYELKTEMERDRIVYEFAAPGISSEQNVRTNVTAVNVGNPNFPTPQQFECVSPR